jgi:xylulokinase
MMALLGIDLGTSAVKAVIVDERGQPLGVGTREIPMEMPLPGRAEQDPRTWWASTAEAVREAVAAAGVASVSAIGLDGHMHGVTLLDCDREPLGRSITWADQRGGEVLSDLLERVGGATFLEVSGTLPAAGFMAPTLAWLERHEPERLAAAAACLLPKDYLRLRMTGELATDVSDASATALFDIRTRTWSADLCAALGIPERILPPVLESAQVAGRLGADAAAELGLPGGIPVVAGCADQAAQATANGLLEPGDGSVTVGTGGQIFCPADRPLVDPEGRIHTFCHAVPGRWYLLGATLCAGLSLRWLRDLLSPAAGSLSFAELDRLAAQVPAGSEGLVFLPYLVGERSPLMDPHATGAFVGLRLRHGRGHLARAILEGVACSLRATRDAIRSASDTTRSWVLTGNGMASPLWRGIVADTYGEPMSFSEHPNGTGVGSALIAGIGTGVYAGYAQAAEACRRPLMPVEPDASRVAVYDELFWRFQSVTATLLAEEHTS